MTGARTKLLFLNVHQTDPEAPIHTQTADQLLHRGRIQSLDAGWSVQATTLQAHLPMPDGISISKKAGRMFWTCMGTPGANDGSINSAKLDGSDSSTILEPGAVNTPKQLVVDDEAGKLYFSDREGLRVHRCNFDGSQHEVIIQTGDWQNEAHRHDQMRWCVGIAVSHKLGKFFWTQKGAPKSGQGRIMAAQIEMPDGASSDSRGDVEVVAEGLPEPIDLEIDEESSAIYFTDRGEIPIGNTLSRKTLAGPVPDAEKRYGREVLAEGFGEAIGLALDKAQGCVWVTDLCGRIWKCDARRPARKLKVYEDETACLAGLAIVPS